MFRNIKPEDIFFEAQLAKSYARNIIKKGCTQIENNNLGPEYFDALYTGVLRGVRPQIYFSDRSRLEEEDVLFFYESSISLSAKYSLGNCSELARQALDYFLIHSKYQNIPVELYKILNGDHTILVVGRDPISDPSDPSTWGQHAFICDPWANKVYHASHYLRELKTFCRVYDSNETRVVKNITKNFNPNKHKLMPVHSLNLTYLKKMRDVENLKKIFLNKISQVAASLKTHQQSLLNTKKQLNGEREGRAKVISDIENQVVKIDSLLKKIEAISTQIHVLLDPNHYRKTRDTLQKILKDIFHAQDNMLQRFDNKETLKDTRTVASANFRLFEQQSGSGSCQSSIEMETMSRLVANSSR